MQRKDSTGSGVIQISGLLMVVSGAAWLLPAITARVERSDFTFRDYMIASIGPLMLIGGVVAVWRGFHALRVATFPPAVRAAILCNGLFVAFCVMEFGDGLLRQHGRIFYWTTLLFVPSLALFYGQALARRWAWWGARILTAIFSLWFLCFLFVIPFAHLRGNGGAAPWWGKVYACCVTILFGSCAMWAVRSLGSQESRAFYGLRPKSRDGEIRGEQN